MNVDFYVDKYIVEVEKYVEKQLVSTKKYEFGVCEDAVEFAKKSMSGNNKCKVQQIRNVVWY